MLQSICSSSESIGDIQSIKHSGTIVPESQTLFRTVPIARNMDYEKLGPQILKPEEIMTNEVSRDLLLSFMTF